MEEAIALQKLLEGESESVSELKKQLSLRGWAFVRLTDELLQASARITPLLRDFFAQKVEEKDQFTEESSIFGYQRVNHKESYRWLTNERFKHDHLPPVIKDELISLTELMDLLMTLLTNSTCKPVFGIEPEELGKRHDIALFSPSAKKFGMLDVAHYLNDTDKYFDKSESAPIPPKNCVEHYDPGLYSLSFYSSQPGLQLLDISTHKWVDGPCNTIEKQSNYAILWCGSAASVISDGKIKPAIHRVEYPESPTPGFSEAALPRMAIWYEICTASQETDYLKLQANQIPNNIFVPDDSKAPPRTRTTKNSDDEKKSKRKMIKHLLSFKKSDPPKNSVERKTGVPMSKSKARRIKPKSEVDAISEKLDPFSLESMQGVPMSKVETFDDIPEFIPEEPKKKTKKRKNKMIPVESNSISMDYELEMGVPMSKVETFDDIPFFLDGEETDSPQADLSYLSRPPMPEDISLGGNSINTTSLPEVDLLLSNRPEFDLGVPMSKSMPVGPPQFLKIPTVDILEEATKKEHGDLSRINHKQNTTNH